MKTKDMLVVGFVSTLLMSGSTVFAVTNQPSSVQQAKQQQVWVVKDLTKQDGYKVVNKTYDQNHQLISTATVTPPAGSLVEFKQETLKQAQTQHLEYIIPTSTQPLDQQLSQLHAKLFQDLNPSGTTIQPNDSISCGTSTISNGQFAADVSAISYNIYWNKENPNCNINVTQYNVWQSSGPNTTTLDQVAWDGFDDNWGGTLIPSSNGSVTDAGPFGSDSPWYGLSGYQFRVLVWGQNGTSYEGYDTLY